MRTALTAEQKLEALSAKYYYWLQWEPKKGDYYTTCRNDLELYQIVEETEASLITKYCTDIEGTNTTEWPKERFLLDFGERRVFVPEYIFELF